VAIDHEAVHGDHELRVQQIAPSVLPLMQALLEREA